MHDTYEYWGIATCMLIATLQQMIVRNLPQLTFSLSLDTPPSDDAALKGLQLIG
jgi:hypothetical protein